MTITAFERQFDGGRGLARDTRVRWALEEVGQFYQVRLVSFRAMNYPFGQIPTYEEGGLALFETGAIVFHIAEHHAGLLPTDPNARARAITWMFAALSTVEPPILDLGTAKPSFGGRSAPPSGGRSRSRPAEATRRSPGRGRVARWCVQRRRLDDGVGAAPVESIGHPGRIPEPGRLRRPRRSATCVQASLRGSTGGQHRQAIDRLIASVLGVRPYPPSPQSGTTLPLRVEVMPL